MFKRILFTIVLLTAPLVFAKGELPPPPPAQDTTLTRTWAMGFGFIPPRPTVKDVLKGINIWSQRAEYAAIHEELPWKDLLSGMSPDAILDRDKVKLVEYMRGKGLKLFFMADPNDGLSRGEEAPQLRALKRSITEPEVQKVFRAYVLAVDKKLKPEIIGLMAETNLVRSMASPAVYAAAVRMANDTAAELKKSGSHATLMTSVQVDTAWGKLATNGPYGGIEKDFADFPFMQMLGYSTYPYFAFAKPEDIPDNYFSKLLNGRAMPVMITEGGWTSASIATIHSSKELQARYVTRMAQLADSVKARCWVQLLFADIDLSSFPKPQPEILPLFTGIGLVDADFKPKPALQVWDQLHGRKLAQ